VCVQLVCIEGTLDLAGVLSLQAVYTLLTAHERSADIFRAITDVDRTDCADGSILLKQVQVNSRTHVPQKLTSLISLCTNPVSILSAPIQTVNSSP
jgi:hypothetical protein